jgi:competence protein ComEA
VGQWFERYRGALFFLFIVAAIIGLALFEARRPQPVPLILTSVPDATPSPVLFQATPTLGPMQIYVSGAVQHPDVYLLPPGSIVKDAIGAAGGALAEADLDRVNLAQPLTNSEHVYVPHIGEENLPVRLPTTQPLLTDKINVNTADLAALESLPGIGPVLAQQILDYRQAHGPFVQVEDLLEVPGIGPATLDEIRGRITTG